MNSSISNSKRLPVAFLIALTLIILSIIGGVIYLQNANTFPAPMFARRFSFDEKMRFIRMNPLPDVEIITLGSSTGFSGVSSEVMFSHPDIQENYFNFSVWNLTAPAVLEYWKFIEKIASPKVVILYLDLYEFMEYKNKLIINEADLIDYLDGASPFWYYLKYHGTGFGRRIKLTGRRRTHNDDFHSIQFDRGGGVSLEFPEDKISHKSWHAGVVPENFVESSYAAMDELLVRLREKGVQAILVQGAIRERYEDNDPNYKFLDQHFARLASMAEKNGMHFFDMKWALPESGGYFVDAAHLSRAGSRLFTEKLLKRMEEAGVLPKGGEGIAYSE